MREGQADPTTRPAACSSLGTVPLVVAVRASETGETREFSLRSYWGGNWASRPRADGRTSPGAPGVRSACVGLGRTAPPWHPSSLRQGLVFCLWGEPGPSHGGPSVARPCGYGASRPDAASPAEKGESGLSLGVCFGMGTVFWGLQEQPPSVGRCRLRLFVFLEREFTWLSNEYEDKQRQAGLSLCSQTCLVTEPGLAVVV